MARPCVRCLLSLLGVLAACTSGKEPPAVQATGPGIRIAAGEARAFSASADGAWLAWLDGCNVARGQYLPPGTASCDLRVAPSGGGDAKRVAGAVTTLPQGLAWSPVGAALAALADFDYAAGSGTLVLWRDGKATELAREVTFHGFGKNGELGFVTGGKLSVLLPGERAPRSLAGAEGIASFDVSAADPVVCKGAARVRLLARQMRSSGGQLLAADCRLEALEPLAGKVGEYGFSPDGELLAFSVDAKDGAQLQLCSAFVPPAPRTAGRAVQRFAFASTGSALAFIGDVVPGRQGNLYVAGSGGAVTKLAKDVGEFRWAAKAPRLAWLEKYDQHVRSGVLGAGGPGLVPRTYGKNITDFDVSADGRFVAFLQHTARGGYSVDLGLAALDGKAAPASIAQGVFGFAFSPDAKWLYYRTRCVRNGEGCDLERVPVAGLPKDGKPELLAQGMKSFEFDPRDPSRLLIGWQRSDRPALDIAVWQGGKLVRLGEVVLPGSARFLGPDSRRVGWAVSDPKRAGIYVAELPR